MIHSLSDMVTLNNRKKIPGLGFGVFQISNNKTAEAVQNGIINGYRLIDTAVIYGNEEGTGKGIKEGLNVTGLSREDLFITSKVWNDHISYEETIQAFEDSLTRLQLDYLDLYLLHWPGKAAYRDSWLALESLYQAGKIKSIGVSNFEISHLEDLLTFASVIPVLDQVELHPQLAQNKLRAFTQKHGIKLQAWSPLMQGQLLNHPVIEEIAAKHQKLPSQVILRWDIQRETLLVVKSIHPRRMIENASIFDFSLDQEDMKRLSNLDQGLRNGPNPNEFDF